MSTVPETIVARHMGIEVLGISCVTNLAAGLGATQLSHEEVSETGRQVEQRLAGLLERLAPKIAAAGGSGDGTIVSESDARAPGATGRGCPFRRWCWGLRAVRAQARPRWRRSWRTRWAESTFISTTTIATWGTCRSASASSRTLTIPAMIESPLLAAHVAALARGEAIERPIYDFATHTRVVGQTERVTPGAFLVVEGLFALYYPELLPLYNLRVYIDTPDDALL